MEKCAGWEIKREERSFQWQTELKLRTENNWNLLLET